MGYDIARFEGEVVKALICPICAGVLEKPLYAPQCEHAFCTKCINEWLLRQHSCPIDSQPITPNKLKAIPHILGNLLSDLLIKCDNASFGCTAVIKLEHLEVHHEECEHNPKRPVPCKQSCGLVVPKDEKVTNESSNMNIIKNGYNPVDEAHKMIANELIDDAILSVCFEVHRAEKLKRAYALEEYVEYGRNPMDVKQQVVRCYLCFQNQSPDIFSKHLASCMGCTDNIKRKASQKITSFKESEDESDYSDSDGKPNSSKRKVTKKGTNNRSKQSRRQGSSDNGFSYIGMTQEEKKAFLNQHCGVLAKRSKMPCKMNTKCTRHSEKERRNVRNNFISDITDEYTNNEVIDVDSIDEGLGSEQIFMPS